jgi:hypothetical protein
LAHLSAGQQIEAEDDNRDCARRGSNDEARLKKEQRKTESARRSRGGIMTKTMHGRVHGKTIELDEDLGVVAGQEVEVQVTMLKPKKRLPGPPPGWRPGSTETAAGMMAEHWCEEDDRILEAIERDRH